MTRIFKNNFILGALIVFLNQGFSLYAIDSVVLKAEKQRVQVIKKVSPSVVAVFGADGGGGGSGVLISPKGFALTNYHVVAGTNPFFKCGLNDGKVYDAILVGLDPTGDVALIQLLGRNDFPVSEMGDSDSVRVGDWAYVIGNPFLLASDFQPTVTYGIVSGIHRYQYPSNSFLEYTDCIQVDSSINPGNSGGPLFDSTGKIIGINGRASFEKRGRVNSGAGYAISINQIKHFMGHLKSGRVVDHATLGAYLVSDSDGNLRVEDILETSDAYRRGLRIDHRIISFAGRPITSLNQYKNILGIFPKGWIVPIVYRENDQRKEIRVRLSGLHLQSELNKYSLPDPGWGKKSKKLPFKLPSFMKKKKIPKPPKKHMHLFKAKPGYANYYFNEKEQNRFLNSIKKWGDYSKLENHCTIMGRTDKGEKAEFLITEKAIGLEINDQAYVQLLDGEAIDEPKGTGGLLTAINHLFRLLKQGQNGFTDFYYLGYEPEKTSDEINQKYHHVLVSVYQGVMVRWLYSVSDLNLTGMDLFLQDGVDPCSIRWSKVSKYNSIYFPQNIRIIHGDQLYREIEIENLQFKKKK